MAKFNEMPFRTQLAVIVGAAVMLSAGFYFVQLKGLVDANKASTAVLKAKLNENAQLRPYRDKEKELETKIASLQQQLEILKKIVPDEKEAPEFMHIMQSTAAQAGVEIRRYTSKPIATKEFYSEAPFEIDLDGPYYSLVDFFTRVSKLERIINVANLQMSNVKKPMDARVRRAYAYASSESTVASCLATTFFSHDSRPAPPPRPGAAAPRQGN